MLGTETLLDSWKLVGTSLLDLTWVTQIANPIAGATTWTYWVQVDSGFYPALKGAFLGKLASHLWNLKSFGSWPHGFSANSQQPSLCLHAILCATPEDFGAWIGIKCSSFSKMNRGTSMRSAFASMGHWLYHSVEMANAMCERSLNQNFRTLVLCFLLWDISSQNGECLKAP